MNVSRESHCLTFVGKLFHLAAAEWQNDPLNVTSLVAVVARPCDNERRLLVGTYAGMHGVSYSGIPVCQILNTSVANLKDTREYTGASGAPSGHV